MHQQQDNPQDPELEKLTQEIKSILVSFENDSAKYDSFYAHIELAHKNMLDDKGSIINLQGEKFVNRIVRSQKEALLKGTMRARKFAIEAKWPAAAFSAVKQSKKLIPCVRPKECIGKVADKNAANDCISIAKLFLAEGNCHDAKNAYNWLHAEDYDCYRDWKRIKPLKTEIKTVESRQNTVSITTPEKIAQRIDPLVAKDFITVLKTFKYNISSPLKSESLQHACVGQLNNE